MADAQWALKWKQVAELGQGGQGTTYEVVSFDDSKERGVLKLLRDDGSQQARGRMAHEAINLETLSKEGVKVPRLFDHNTQQFADASVQLYLVMEYVPGQTLDKVVKARGGRLALEESVAIANDLCETLALMHKQDVLHRDLKPANLMVRDLVKADLVVLDFGLSFHRDGTQESLTRTGEKIKNELLALPEANTVSGDRRDTRSDITNIVGVFYYCLTGHLPELLRDERNMPPHRRPARNVRDVMAGDKRVEQVEFLLDCGFDTDIDARFQTIEELQERLRLVLSPSSVKKDPLQADAELGARLRRRDRKLQLDEFARSSSSILNRIAQYVQTLHRMQTFTVSVAGGGRLDEPYPGGIEPVLDGPYQVVVGLRTRPHTRVIRMRIGAKGDRCVLLHSTVLNKDSRGLIPAPWEEAAWFDPLKPPEEQVLKDWVNGFVVAAMEEFEREEQS